MVREDFCEPMWVEGGEETGKGLKAHVRGFYCDTNLHRTFSQILEVSNFSFPYILYAAAAKSHQSYPTLCDPIDGSPPGSPVPGILQARILEWVAISFSSA